MRNEAIWGLAAEGLELEELVESAEIDGVRSGFVAAENIVIVRVLDHVVGEGSAFGDRFVLVEMLLEEGDLREMDALDAVERGGDLGHQKQFLDSDRLVVGDQLELGAFRSCHGPQG